MEYSLQDFVNQIRQNLYVNFPYENDDIKRVKHRKTPLHIRDVALGMPTFSGDMAIFEIGNDYAESEYPYYHILEDAEVIRKRGRGNKQSKGSQANKDVIIGRTADYGRITFNGKTYSQEYRKNVRGSRSRVDKATYKMVGSDGKVYTINKNANFYKNIHYHYIERILETTLPWIASECGLKMGRTQLTSLEEEYNLQEMLDGIMSHEES